MEQERGAGKIYEYGNIVTYTLNLDGTISYSSTNGVNADNIENQSSFTYFREGEWVSLSTEKSAVIENKGYAYYPQTLTSNIDDDLQGISTNSAAYEMLFADTVNGENAYWLGNNYVETHENYIKYGLRGVGAGRVALIFTYYSYLRK